jgi:hypothetical protein
MSSQGQLAQIEAGQGLDSSYLEDLLRLRERNFNSILKLAGRRMSLYSEDEQDLIYKSLNRGVAILESEAQIDKYIQAFGRKHYLKFMALFQSVSFSVFDGLIDFVDWGCGAGLGLIALNDFIRKHADREIESGIRNIILIEPSAVALERARAHAELLFPESDVVTIQKCFEDLSAADFPPSALGIPRLHLFSNVFDLNVFESSTVFDDFTALIKRIFRQDEYFLLASPTYNSIERRFKRMVVALEDDDVSVEEILAPVEKVFTKKDDGVNAKMTATAASIRSKRAGARLGKVKHHGLIRLLNLKRDSSHLQRDLVRDICMQFSPEECEVLYRPNLMGAVPDMLLLKKGYKAKLIYVCESTCLAGINIDEIKAVARKANDTKDHIINFLSIELLNKKVAAVKKEGSIRGGRHLYGSIECVVYVCTQCECDVQRLRKVEDELDYTTLHIQGCSWCWRSSPIMDESVYIDLKQLTTPRGIETKDLSFGLDKKQRELSDSYAMQSKKIFGVFGSGKTTLLVARAIAARRRTHKTVLILTFNITLRNYIENLLLQMFGQFNRDEFYVVNYHEFIRGEFMFAGLNSKGVSFNDYKYFQGNRVNFTRKYESIFIDEAQDYKYEWLEIIKNIFLSAYGEYVLFGDEKQNIYDQPLDKKKIRTNVLGAPVRLTTCHRSNFAIADKVGRLQREMFSSKYELDDFDVSDELALLSGCIGVINVAGGNENKLADVIHQICEKEGDPTVLGSAVDVLRSVEELYRQKTGRNTETMFLRAGEIDVYERESAEWLAELTERGKKLHFNPARGVVKFCTVHSYKGFEAETVIAIISPSASETEEEIIYTALTRARTNLFIINFGKTKYGKILQNIFGSLDIE